MENLVRMNRYIFIIYINNLTLKLVAREKQNEKILIDFDCFRLLT